MPKKIKKHRKASTEPFYPHPKSKLGFILEQVRQQIVVKPRDLKDKALEHRIKRRAVPVYLLTLKWRGLLRQPAFAYYSYIHKAQFPSRTCAELANYFSTYPEQIYEILQKQSHFELACGCKFDFDSFKMQLDEIYLRTKELFQQEQIEITDSIFNDIFFENSVEVIKQLINYIKEASTCDIRKRERVREAIGHAIDHVENS